MSLISSNKRSPISSAWRGKVHDGHGRCCRRLPLDQSGLYNRENGHPPWILVTPGDLPGECNGEEPNVHYKHNGQCSINVPLKAKACHMPTMIDVAGLGLVCCGARLTHAAYTHATTQPQHCGLSQCELLRSSQSANATSDRVGKARAACVSCAHYTPQSIRSSFNNLRHTQARMHRNSKR